MYQGAAYAESTKAAYASQRRRYVEFCGKFCYIPIPASSQQLCRYVAYLAESMAASSIKNYLNVVRIMHIEKGLTNPLKEDYQLHCVIRGVRRIKGDTVHRKLPLMPYHLQFILAGLDLQKATDCNIWAAILVAFFGMFRRSNVVPPSSGAFDQQRHTRRRDIKIFSDRAEITIRWSKTIQYRERQHVLPLPRIKGAILCPVTALHRAFSLTPWAAADGPAFVTSSKGLVTTDDLVQAIKSGVVRAGGDPQDYSGHSLRRGGASLAYRCGVPIETIRKIGDWKSDSYKSYIFDSYDSLLKCMTIISSSV